jgi:cell division protein FtsB
MERVDELTQEVARLRAENAELRDTIDELRAELRRLGRYVVEPARVDKPAGDDEIVWAYQRDDLEDDLGDE